MNSEYAALELTDAQRLADELFIKDVEDTFVRPLVDELQQCIPGFDSMSPMEKELSVLKLNEPLFGRGDCLRVRGKLFYAGRKLGHLEEMAFGDVSVSQYQPRFVDSEPTKLHFEPNGDGVKSDLELFFTEERAEYDALPVSYRTALLYIYIGSKVIADPDEIMSFVLGQSLVSGELLRTKRFHATPIYGNTGLYRGWKVRFRDGRPGSDFSKELGRYIRAEVEKRDAIRAEIAKEENSLEPQWKKSWAIVSFEDGVNSKRKRKQRRPDSKVEFACVYIHALEQKGVVIDARKGGIGFEKIMADLELNYPDKVRHWSAETLSKNYRNWKKRNGLM